jgi:beta-glucosidase
MTLADKITMVDGTGFEHLPAGYVGHISAIPRLCLPGLNLEDGPLGIGDNVTGVTQLPDGLALAATFDTGLARQYGGVVGEEARKKGVDVNLGPTVNIVRDPRWGRAFESYGEDQYLSGEMGAGYIRGVQNSRVMAQLKHWAVYNQETNRNTPEDNVVVSPRTLQETYMRQFGIAIRDGDPASVMCSYSAPRGSFACENAYILGVLKDDWKFPGFVTSDWGATHSSVASARAGLDMNMPGLTRSGDDYFGEPLKRAVEAGQVPMSRLDDMVSRILREMFRFDLVAHPGGGSLTDTATTPQHAAVGRTVAQEGTVLLKNADSRLPLHPASDTKIAVIGSDAGQWAEANGGGSAAVVPPAVVTPLQGISDRARRAGIDVQYAQGDVPLRGALAPIPASSFGDGLKAAFYNNATTAGAPAATAALSDLDQSWPGSPAAGVEPHRWSATITGRIRLPTTGVYDFSLVTTSPAQDSPTTQVEIDGRPVISGSATQAGRVSTSRDRAGETAGVHRISVRYAAPQSGPAILQVGWAPAGSAAVLQREAVAAARSAKVAVVFANLFGKEGKDLPNIDLPSSQNALISAVADANPNSVVVLNTGAAVTMPWLSQVDAVVEAWYPGQDDGTDIAAVLFGDVNPSGKLPVTFPRSLSQVPANTQRQWPGVDGRVYYSEGLLVGYRWYTTKNIEPMFPFGYGLSYTTFRFSDLRVSKTSATTVTVSLKVTNTGSRTGADVAQVYVRDPRSTGEPTEQLRAFARVDLRPGQTRSVRLTLGGDAFAWWRPQTRDWTVTPGTYTVSVGDSSTSLALSQQVAL